MIHPGSSLMSHKLCCLVIVALCAGSLAQDQTVSHTNGRVNDFGGKQKIECFFPDPTSKNACGIEGDREHTCNGKGDWVSSEGRCDCDSGWGGDYCQVCAYGVDSKVQTGSSAPEPCSDCDNKAGFYGTPPDCKLCPCTLKGWQAMVGDNNAKPLWYNASRPSANQPPNVKTPPCILKNSKMMCNCKANWGGPFCQHCDAEHYDEVKPDGTVVPCNKTCNNKDTCGGKLKEDGLGYCNSTGDCVCMVGAKPLDGGCERCEEGDTATVTENGETYDLCSPDFIPADYNGGNDTRTDKTGKNGCGTTKWWIGLIIAGSAALLLALVIGGVMIAMSKSKDSGP